MEGQSLAGLELVVGCWNSRKMDPLLFWLEERLFFVGDFFDY